MFRKLNYLWRLFATGLSFSVFGIGGLLLSGIAIPLILVLSPIESTRRNRVRKLISGAFTFFFWMMHYLGILRYKVIGRELIKADKSCLVIANHPSLIDVISLISLYPHSCCIVKKELWSNFFVKKVVSSAGYIPNEDPERLLANCSESLNRGDVLIIFPEGTRTVPGQEMTLQRGAAHVALRLKCPVRTIQIEVIPPALTKNRPWYSIPARRMDFTVTIKEALDVTEYVESGLPLSLASRRLTKKMRENIDKSLPKIT